ncbi:MAG TPA: hypothetical protein PLZ08_10580 [Bacillota bacterium]|jgi:Tol biopolymer transport system component|nr:hypothetical protein [Bacillota bacterium]HOL10741.1 hypothetical protein [Bacillota bacterium]HPO98383.1 hypothetical protein [Bacillota bacterium]
MKSPILWLLCFLIVCSILPCNAELQKLSQGPKLVYMDANNQICLTDLDNVKPQKIGVGLFPKISPDGEYVVYKMVNRMLVLYSCKTKSSQTLNSYVKDFTGPEWSPNGDSFIFCTEDDKLAVYSLKTKSAQILSGVPGDCYSELRWSPDGTNIVLVATKEGKDEVVIALKNNQFKIISKSLQSKSKTYFQPCWSQNGRSVFFHDREYIYEMDLQGKLLQQWSIERIIKPDMFTATYLMTDDRKSWICLIGADDEEDYQLYKEKRCSIYRYDIATGKRVRLLPKGLFADSMNWMSGRKAIIFDGYTKTNSGFDYSIYTLSIPAGKLQKIVKGYSPSCSN